MAQGLESNHVLSPPVVRCPVPSVPQEQAHADIAHRPALTPHAPRTQALGKAAGDPLRSPPAAAPVETNRCLLTNHLPQMWQERSPGCFSHKFLPSSLSGFPRQARAIIALQAPPYYAERNRFSAWGRLKNTPKGEDCRVPKNGCSGPVILKNQRAFH